MLAGRSLELISPSIGEKDKILQPSVQVRVLRDGVLDVGLVSGMVHLRLEGPYPGVLSGTTSRTVVGGIATFDVSVNVPGDYDLVAYCENIELQNTLDPNISAGALKIWRVYGIPLTPTLELRGRWINFHGSGVPIGIWAKIIDGGTHPDLGDFLMVEQPLGATSLDLLLTHPSIVTIRYNSANPLMQPPDWYLIGADPWFLWDPSNGTNLGSSFYDTIDRTLEDRSPLQIFRTVSVRITDAPSRAMVNTTHGVLAVIQNPDESVATDLNDEAIVEVQEGNTVLSSDTVPVVNGNIFTKVLIPPTEGIYSIWVKYQGTWFGSSPVYDARSVEAYDIEDPEDPPPDTPPAKFPPKEFGLAAGGCTLTFSKACELELAASDPHIEVLVK